MMGARLFSEAEDDEAKGTKCNNWTLATIFQQESNSTALGQFTQRDSWRHILKGFQASVRQNQG